MEKCKFCDAELEEGVTLCANCGKDNAETEPQETALTEPVADAEEIVTAPISMENAAAAENTEDTPAESTKEESTKEEPTKDESTKEEPKATPGKIALAIVGIVVMVALIIAMLVGGMGGKSDTVPATTAPAETAAVEETVPATTPADTNANDETCKGSYTVSNEDAVASAGNVVATIGDKTLTNAQLQVYYWSYAGTYASSEYGYQAMMYGALDLSKPLDTQISLADPGLTWQQYFLRCALQNWQSLQTMALEAAENGHTITAEAQAALDAIPADMESMLESYGAESVDELIEMNMGAGVTLDDFIDYQRTYYEGAPYYNEVTAGFTATEEEVEAFFTEREEQYAEQGLTRDDQVVDVRHVLIMPEGATNETIRTETFSDEAWAASEKKANELLENWKKGDKSEESFAQMANENTDDGNDSNMDGQPDGGLYTGVTEGQMVEEFEAWCFDASRKPGDVGIVKTIFGYHIMYFVQGEPMWPHYAQQDLIAMKENDFLMGVIEKYPMEVDYSAVCLADITTG